MMRVAMVRVSVAALAMVAGLSFSSTARSQACTCCGCGAPELLPSAAPAGLDPELASGPSQAELKGVLAGGATAAIASYVVGVLVARTQTHPMAAIDDIPIAGAVASAARNAPDDRNTPLLLFSASVQAMGLLVIAAAAADLSALRRFSVDVGVGPNGCGASLTWRLP
jgi:hypothetical protein